MPARGGAPIEVLLLICSSLSPRKAHEAFEALRPTLTVGPPHSGSHDGAAYNWHFQYTARSGDYPESRVFDISPAEDIEQRRFVPGALRKDSAGGHVEERGGIVLPSPVTMAAAVAAPVEGTSEQRSATAEQQLAVAAVAGVAAATGFAGGSRAGGGGGGSGVVTSVLTEGGSSVAIGGVLFPAGEDGDGERPEVAAAVSDDDDDTWRVGVGGGNDAERAATNRIFEVA